MPAGGGKTELSHALSPWRAHCLCPDMLRFPSLLVVVVTMSPQALTTLEHHFGDHHDSGSSGSGSGCSSSSSSSSASASPDPSVTLPKKHVFITHATFAANLGGSNGADAKCQAAASSAGLSGNFVALVSSGNVSALSRVTSKGPFDSVNQELAYPTKSDFLATSFSIVTDELGHPASTEVWSGSDVSGLASTHDCLSWTSVASTDDATLGSDDATNLNATNGFGAGDVRAACNLSHSLFCVEQ